MGDKKQPIARADVNALLIVLRKRERVLKMAVDERSTALRADFEAQMARIYEFDNDETWRKAHALAEEVTAQQQEIIRARCRELGIPSQFAPEISLHWYRRGENATAERRTELRHVATSRIAAIATSAKTAIERQSLEVQTDVIAAGLQSQAARDFLERMPDLETLMQPLDVKALVDGGQRTEGGSHG